MKNREFRIKKGLRDPASQTQKSAVAVLSFEKTKDCFATEKIRGQDSVRIDQLKNRLYK